MNVKNINEFRIPINTKNNNSKKNDQTTNRILILNSSKILERFGWYQIRSFIFLSSPSFCAGMFVAGFVFFNIVPSFDCQEKKEIFENISKHFENLELRQNFYTENDHCVRLSNHSNKNYFLRNQSLVNITIVKESCSSQLVFNTRNGNTVVSQFGLVCEFAWLRPFTTGSFMIGMFIGSLFGVRLADKFGRRLTSLCAFVASTVFIFVTPFSPSYVVYFPLSFLTGSFQVLFYLITYTWLIEVVGSADKRFWSAFTHSVAYSGGGMSMSLVAYLAQDWNRIYFASGVIYCISFIACLFVSESPSWLLQKNKQHQAAKVLKNIIKTNNIEIDGKDNELEDFSTGKNSENSAPAELSIVLLWKNAQLRKRLFLSSLLWAFGVLSFYINALNSANLGGNAYLNNVIGNSLEILATIFTTVVLKKCGRRSSLSFLAFLSGCFFLATPVAKQKNNIAGICMAMLGRFSANTFLIIAMLFSGELFPTMLRSTSIFICAILSRLSAIFAPFLIFAGEEVNWSIPFYVMGGISFVSVYLALLLPETSASYLPNTLDDALALKEPSLLPKFKLFSKKLDQETVTAASSAVVNIG